ncbi:reversion-inducing cysteine-rich protein with Kazal motifs-like [Clytia hemisphaerica]
MLELVLLVTSLMLLVQANQLGLNQCYHVIKSDGCRRACRKLTVPNNRESKEKFTQQYVKNQLMEIAQQCTQPEAEFWKCLDKSALMKDFRKKKRKYHGTCCKEAIHTSCEVECLTTKKISKLLKNERCNANREPKFTSCIKKVHAARKCCSGSTKECKHSCMQYFKNVRSNNVLQLKQIFQKKCGRRSKQFKCALTNSNFDRAIQNVNNCCNHSHNKRCHNSCNRVLGNLDKDFKTAFKQLTDDCGELHVNSPLYRCLLDANTQTQRIEDVPNRGRTTIRKPAYQSFKQQCCDRAVSPDCRKWCQETMADPKLMLSLWGTMYLSCIQSPKEVALSNCMTDVFEPCEIGVKEPMTFCTNLNEHPMSLFRRGDQSGDLTARKLHKFWSDGVVKVFGYKLVFKDISTCQPEMFKAMACLLATKPCDHRHSQIQVCRHDCEILLTECLNHDISDYAPNTVQDICANILPNNNQSNCIPLRKYAVRQTPSTALLRRVKPREDVTLPCRNDPCGEDEVCLINQECLKEDENSIYPCPKYKCVKGCPVNVNSKLIIPLGEMAKLRDGESDCYQVCECQYANEHNEKSTNTVFKNCKKFLCNQKRSCTRGKMTYRDGDTFHEQCNTCTCIDGTFECTKKNCGLEFVEESTATGRHRRHHGSSFFVQNSSPCNCHDVYKPVCALNVMTYPNACLAKCSNISDINLSVGDCRSIHPCDLNSCDPGKVCVPFRRVCLAPWTSCQQYECSSPSTTVLRYMNSNPTCGKFSNKGKVCGFDSVTYQNECEAFESGTGVDYRGSCIPENIRTSATTSSKERCRNVQCEPIIGDNCDLFTPPGSCCPKCGSMLRLLYSKQDLEKHKQYISLEPITVKELVKRLREQLKVAECQVHGHLTVENDLLVMLLVDSQKPTRDQITACRTEAQRFHKYINNSSPITQTNYYLSLLKASDLQTVEFHSPSSANMLKMGTKHLLSLVILCWLSTLVTSYLVSGGTR